MGPNGGPGKPQVRLAGGGGSGRLRAVTEEFFIFILVGTLVLSVLVVLVAALVPAGRRRGLTDWAMVGGMSLCLVGLLGMLALGFELLELDGVMTYQAIDQLAMALAMAIPVGVLVFGGGLLLSRLEARRREVYLGAVLKGGEAAGPAPTGPGLESTAGEGTNKA